MGWKRIASGEVEQYLQCVRNGYLMVSTKKCIPQPWGHVLKAGLRSLSSPCSLWASWGGQVSQGWSPACGHLSLLEPGRLCRGGDCAGGQPDLRRERGVPKPAPRGDG